MQSLKKNLSYVDTFLVTVKLKKADIPGGLLNFH